MKNKNRQKQHSFKQTNRPHPSKRPHPTSRPHPTAPSIDKNLRRVVGLHACREVLRVRPNKITKVLLKTGAERINDLSFVFEAAHRYQIPVEMKPESVLDQIAASHQGLCFYVSETPELMGEQFARESNDKALLVALDEITDPHNIGAILRSAWLLGAKGLLVPEHRSGHLTPAVHKVASGAAEHVPVQVVHNLVDELSNLKEKGFWIYGLSAEGSNTIGDVTFHERVVLVIGSEEKGLRTSTAKVCDELVRIPQFSAKEAGASFNASVAAAITMYEVFRQQNNS